MSNVLKIAQDVVDAQAKADEENKLRFQELYDELEKVQLGDDVTKSLLAMLALPDGEFELIKPIILSEFNKTFHDSNNQLLMLQTFNANGVKLEELEETINAFIESIDTKDISQSKVDFLKQVFFNMYNALSEIKGIPKRIIEVPIELCHEDAKIPNYANPTDSGMDIYALDDITIHPGETKLIPTGIKVAIPMGYELQVRPKSGRCLKTKLRVANTPGTIDAGYRNEIGVIIDNIEPPIKSLKMNAMGVIESIEYGSDYTIGKGEKFAQLVLVEVSHCAFNQIDSISEIPNDGRNGGFGSTGLK